MEKAFSLYRDYTGPRHGMKRRITCVAQRSFHLRPHAVVQGRSPLIALGGSEAYFARLSRWLAAAGDDVTVFTTNAVDLEAFWSRRGRCAPPGRGREDGVEVRRYPLCRMPAQRWLLKGAVAVAAP